MTELVGREAELRLIAARLAAGRLVTLVGPGGVGKTRLAIAAVATGGVPAEARRSDPSRRVWWVGLAAVADAGDVALAVARALGLRVRADAVEQLAEAFAGARALLVLDNCEHVADPVARLVEALLGRCPGLRVLATSREPLRIGGEALCPVAPLPLEEAERLFTARALAVRPGFVPSGRVGEVCARLDGLPLAIELAAARLRTMTLDRLADGLGDRLPRGDGPFRLLTGGSRTASPRHRTLRGVVEWSWDLLDGGVREAAERAAVFPASFTAEAAAGAGVGEDALHALVDKSLLQLDGDRYRMLGTIREYGLLRLAESGRLRAAREAHAACFLALAESAGPGLRGAGQLGGVARLAAERDHLLAALRTACDHGDADVAVRLGAALAMFWTVRGEHAEAVARLRAALQVPGRSAPGPRRTAVAVFLLNALMAGDLAGAAAALPPDDLGGSGEEGALGAFAGALLALARGEAGSGLSGLEPYLEAGDPWTRGMVWLARSLLRGTDAGMAAGRADLVAAVAGFREAGERWGLALTLMSLASVEIAADAYEAAVAALEEAEGLAADLGTYHELGVWVAMVRVHAGQPERARARLLRLAEEGEPGPGGPRRAAVARVALADLARCEGDLGEAGRQLRLAGEEGDTPYRTLYAAGAGRLAVAAGELEAAARWLGEALALAAAMPDPPMVAQVGVGLTDLLLRRGEPVRAAETLGAAEAVRGGPDARHPDVVRLTRALLVTSGRRAAYERGRRLDRAAALAALRAV
ncbi:AfsR/SARP family transcriptional regulator [Nonomuraea sp. ATR24]|uniref:ATP-binding protein n=1 Tax=Nonomuraea sp. ATR24 TaxID=1676744 RepID=UPI0035BFCBCD